MPRAGQDETRLRRGWIGAAALACAIAAPGPLARPAAEAGPQPVGPREEVLVYLVELEILALDAKGIAVTDLRPEDLVVEERGRPQRIAVFEKHRRPPHGGPLPEGRIHFDGPDGRRPREARGVEPRWFAFVFDLVHGDLRTRRELQEAAREFVDTRLPADSLFAVLSFTGDVHLEQNFTSDPELLRAAVERAFSRPALPVSWEARMRELLAVGGQCQQQMVPTGQFRSGRECMAHAVRTYVRELAPTTERYVDGLEKVARLLAGVQGRKYLFLFSHGVSLDPSSEGVEAVEALAGASYQLQELRFELLDEVEHRRAFYRAIERAIRGDVTVFTLDGSAQPTADTDLQARHGFRRGARPYGRAFETARDGLDELARSTGGKFFGSSDFLTSLDRALLATDGAYTVGYYSDPARARDASDAVKVSVKSRRKGVKISSRESFYYEPPRGTAHLGRLDLEATRLVEGRGIVPFAVTLDPLQFELIRSETEVGLNFTLHLRLLTEQGLPVSDSFHFLSHVFDRALYEGGTVIAPRYEGFLELEPGSWLFSVVIRDPQRFTFAELVQPVRVEAPPAAGR
jgi:VWFA-related protein